MKIKNFLLNLFPKKEEKIPSGELFKKWQVLQNHFQDALLQQKKLQLDKLPWYLIIGPESSGKTSLIQRSNIQFHYPKKPQPAEEEIFQWWATKDLILIDLPGEYFSPKNFLWEQFLKLLTKHCKQKLAGIVLTINFPELSKTQGSSHKKQIVLEARQRILQLKELCGHTLPLYLTIAKCDLLVGFSEFFSECGSDELAQTWGITLPTLKKQEKLVDVFVHRFNALIKRLNSQLIWRLHQERSHQARPYIKDFPLQVERLKDTLASFIKALGIQDPCLTGVYLTSALQVVEKSQQALELSRNSSAFNYRSYFIRQLILQGLLYRSEKPTSPHVVIKEKWVTRSVYSASFAVIAMAAVFLGNDFQRSVQQAYAIQNDLTKYQMAIQQNHSDALLEKSLPLLEALQQAASNSNHRLPNPIAVYSKKSQRTANEVYHQALQTILLPEIKTIFEKYLQAPGDKNSSDVYAVLSAYLMLGNHQNLDADAFANTFNLLMTNKINKNTLEKVLVHIHSALNSLRPVDINNELIDQTRKQLWALPKPELGLIIIKNLYKNNIDSLLALGTNPDNTSVFISKEVANQIPTLFTAASLPAVLQQEIMQAASEIKKGNLVLGNNTYSTDQEDINTLAMELRDRYIANYVDVWESLLENIKLFHANNLDELDAMILNLTGDRSPLLQLLQTVEQNTKFPAVEESSPKLQAMNRLLINPNNAEQNPLFKIFVSLRQLHEYLEHNILLSDEGKRAFDVIKSHTQIGYQDSLSQLRKIAEQSPEPMRTWLTNISQQCWNLLLKQAGEHINLQWKHHVLSYHHQHIASRYPFNASAQQEVSLNHLTEFLGQPGILSQFYQTYLKCFIDESSKEWRWKFVENSKLPFSEKTLQQLHHAMQIQHIFFPNGDNKLYVHFTLEPVGMDASLKKAKISINSQDITFLQASTASPRSLGWPGETPVNLTTLSFTSPLNQTFTETLQSEWGWFKLVNHSTENILSPKKLLLTFNVEGHIAKYYLYTENRLNPFLAKNLEGFELSDLM